MVGYMSLEEQVDKDFRLARRRALLGRVGYGVSLAAKRIYARLSSAWIFLAVRQFPGIFRGDVRGSFLVGSKADGIVHTSTLTGISEEPTMEKAT
jgi:hypothetical protein